MSHFLRFAGTSSPFTRIAACTRSARPAFTFIDFIRRRPGRMERLPTRINRSMNPLLSFSRYRPGRSLKTITDLFRKPVGEKPYTHGRLSPAASSRIAAPWARKTHGKLRRRPREKLPHKVRDLNEVKSVKSPDRFLRCAKILEGRSDINVCLFKNTLG